MSESNQGVKFRDMLRENEYINSYNQFIVKESGKKVSLWISSKYFKGIDNVTLYTILEIASKNNLKFRRVTSSKRGLTFIFLK